MGDTFREMSFLKINEKKFTENLSQIAWRFEQLSQDAMDKAVDDYIKDYKDGKAISFHDAYRSLLTNLTEYRYDINGNLLTTGDE